MVEGFFCSVRRHYLCRKRDCHNPWAVLWSLARLHSVHQKGILNISAVSGCLFSPLVFCFVLIFLLSILSDFQTHLEVLRSKPAVSSFGTDKITLIRRGKGEYSSGVWSWTARQWGALLESFSPGWSGIVWSSQPLHSGVQDCCHTAVPAGVRGLSLLAGFSLLISEISWGFWGGLMLFFWSAQWAEQGTRNQNQSNPSWHWLPQVYTV